MLPPRACKKKISIAYKQRLQALGSLSSVMSPLVLYCHRVHCCQRAAGCVPAPLRLRTCLATACSFALLSHMTSYG